MKKTITVTLRWIAILPTAIASFYLFGILAKLIFRLQETYFGSSNERSLDYILSYYVIEPILSSFVAMGATVIFGSLMAPKHAKTVAIVLMIVICCSELIAFYNENFVNGNYIRNIDIFAGIAGSIIGYIYVLEKNKIAQ